MLESNPFYRKQMLPLPEIDYTDEHAIQREIAKHNQKINQLRDLVKNLHRKKRMLTKPLAIPKTKYVPEMLKTIKNLFPQIYSNRELEVLYWIGNFKSNKEIGEILFIAEKTVKFHKTNIFSKIGLKSDKEVLAKIYEGKL